MSKFASWGDRFALIDHYSPPDHIIRKVFEVSQSQLDVARMLYRAGTIRPNTKLDPKKYADLFDSPITTTPVIRPDVIPGASATTHTTHTTHKTQQASDTKRGRSGNKITAALKNVPTEPMRAETFANQANVSVAVLRQSKRFMQKLSPTEQAEIGTVHVRQDKATKELMIWRTIP